MSSLSGGGGRQTANEAHARLTTTIAELKDDANYLDIDDDGDY